MTVGELKIRMMEDYGGQASIEDMINAVAMMVEEDKAQYVGGAPESESPHPLVVHCLDASIKHLHDAAMAYYASLK